MPAVTHAIQQSLGQTSVRRTAPTLLNVNQAEGFRPWNAAPRAFGRLVPHTAACHPKTTNVLVPLDSVADTSTRPPPQSVIVRPEPVRERTGAWAG
ncbi:hypothetical protein ACWDU9_33190 [Streptomyces cellulosae]